MGGGGGWGSPTIPIKVKGSMTHLQALLPDLYEICSAGGF